MKFVKGHKVTNTGRTHFKKDVRSSPRTEFKKGMTPWNKGLKGYLSEKRKGELNPMYGKRHTAESKLKIGEAQRREKNYNWKGGTLGNNRLERIRFVNTMQKKVLERDSYTCQLCGSKKNLQIDHIQPWSEYVKLRFVIGNCRTVCMECHYQITFGRPMPFGVKRWGNGGVNRA